MTAMLLHFADFDWKSRLRAALVHFLICLCIAAAVLLLMLLVWYPHPYFEASGALRLALIVIGVDVVVGPVLTFVVFKRGKRTLKFDLSVIAAIQLAALTYGIHVVYVARPVFLVFAIDQFAIVAANDVDPDSLAKVRDTQFGALSRSGPRLVGAQMPQDYRERERILASAVNTGRDLPQMPHHYVPYEQVKPTVIARAKPLEQLRERHPEAEATLRGAEERARARSVELAYLPVVGRMRDLSALIDRRTGDVFELVQVDPWQ
jgi:hypothetical protein